MSFVVLHLINKKKAIQRLSLLAFIVLPINAWAYLSAESSQSSETDKKLSTVQKQIEKQKSTIVEVSKKRRALDKQLKKDDFAIAKVAKAINKTNRAFTLTKKKIAALTKKQAILLAAKKRQENILAKQLRTAYSTGNHDYLKLLLNQEAASKVERTVTYYQYLNDARIKEIEAFKETLAELDRVTLEQEQQAARLKTLQIEQKKQKLALQKTKLQRSKTLKSLRKDLLTKQQQLAKLQAEESNLVAALKKLSSLSKENTALKGLAKLKKRLSWPVIGKIVNSFGTRKQGYLRWKGVLMSAPVGRQVQSVHNGTVLFADWLKGYGLVTVVDHGDGYMSLYGHNQALLKNVGDTVESGEPIALVGQSGGQNQPGLYFEIRHKGKAVNPKIWCR